MRLLSKSRTHMVLRSRWRKTQALGPAATPRLQNNAVPYVHNAYLMLPCPERGRLPRLGSVRMVLELVKAAERAG